MLDCYFVSQAYFYTLCVSFIAHFNAAAKKETCVHIYQYFLHPKS
jgi:hypothetical protein